MDVLRKKERRYGWGLLEHEKAWSVKRVHLVKKLQARKEDRSHLYHEEVQLALPAVRKFEQASCIKWLI